MKETKSVKNGVSAYQELPVNHVNNSDLREVYELSFEPKLSLGGIKIST